MLLLDNFVHSDLHPGNIMVKFTKPLTTAALLKKIWASIAYGSETSTIPLDGGFSESNEMVIGLRQLAHSSDAWHSELLSISDAGYMPEVVFIDAGLVTTLDVMNRQNFLDLFRAVAQFDGYRAGQLMVERCRTPHLVVDAETFALKMQHIVLSVKRKTFSLGQIKISDVLTEVLKAVRQHHVKLEGDFINTIVSILLLEGTGRQLDPGLDLFKSALPILRQLGRQMGAQEQVGKMPSGNFSALLKVSRFSCVTFVN
jgi:aarF domain-containing kinase